MENARVCILDRVLVNGLSLTVTDASRPLAGDRWLVRLMCTIRLSPERARELLSESHQGILAETTGQRLCREGVVQPIFRERNFVAAEEVAGARGDLLRYLTGPLLRYLEADAYPRRMLSRRLEELARVQPVTASPDGDDGEEESGPADFSHLFR